MSKQNLYPMISTLSKVSQQANKGIRSEMKRFGKVKFDEGFHYAIGLIRMFYKDSEDEGLLIESLEHYKNKIKT